MYSYLRGVYKGHTPGSDGSILLEVAGIGYEVIVPPIVDKEIGETCPVDQPLLLFVSDAQLGEALAQSWPEAPPRILLEQVLKENPAKASPDGPISRADSDIVTIIYTSGNSGE